MLVFVQRERNNIVFTRQSNWRPLCTEMEGSLLVKYAVNSSIFFLRSLVSWFSSIAESTFEELACAKIAKLRFSNQSPMVLRGKPYFRLAALLLSIPEFISQRIFSLTSSLNRPHGFLVEIFVLSLIFVAIFQFLMTSYSRTRHTVFCLKFLFCLCFLSPFFCF